MCDTVHLVQCVDCGHIGERNRQYCSKCGSLGITEKIYIDKDTFIDIEHEVKLQLAQYTVRSGNA